MDDDKVWLNWVFDRLRNLGSNNVNIESIIIVSSIMNLEFNHIGSTNLQIGVQILQGRVPNMGESHVTLINLAPTLYHFMTLHEVPNKSHCKMLNKYL